MNHSPDWNHSRSLPASLAKFPLLFLVLFVWLGGKAGELAARERVPSSGESEVIHVLRDVEDSSRDRTIPLKIYRVPADSPQPVILFSHGLGGSREGNAYLGNYWAANGYVVVFMQHHGSDREVWESAAPRERLAALKAAVGLQATLDRFTDVPAVIDALEKWNQEEGHVLSGKLDLDRIGLSGHSFGAVTTLGLAGMKYRGSRTSFQDPRIDAFLPMSPQPGKGLSPAQALGHLALPMLCMTGTEDGSPIDPTLSPETRREVYLALPPGDKFQLVFEGAHHFAFGDSKGLKSRQRDPAHHPAIQKISTHFWNAYLRNDAQSKAWLQSDAPREACKLKAGDAWEWK